MFMYRRPIFCTLYGAVDSLNVLKNLILFVKMDLKNSGAFKRTKLLHSLKASYLSFFGKIFFT